MQSDYRHNIIALTIHIKGLVQGVGFRPFIYRLALENHLNGWVVNETDGVIIKVEGLALDMAPFVEGITEQAPAASKIDEMVVDQDMPEGIQGFYIMASQDLSNETSEISPDIAVCPDCLSDMKKQSHRIDYPFINCTNCGPRFSIIFDFPYDREKTTMAPFAMCPVCKDEYDTIADRRFHAQPVACNQCGPFYQMYKGDKVIEALSEILTQSCEIIESSGLIAIKGTGGYHLMCDAFNEEAVNRLRAVKKREGKPFAVMFRNREVLKEYAVVDEAAERALTSWRRPIVILDIKKYPAEGITLGLSTIGAFLPYMPLHYLLFERLKTDAIVLTSGNLSDEPVITNDGAARHTFQGITGAVISYNREIYNRCDDSVLRIISGRDQLQRRARGYTPEPVRLNMNVDGILATGAELSNCFCLGKGIRAYMSQHIGDLKNHETYRFFETTAERFKKLFRVEPSVIVSDMHPDYLSTRYAANTGLKHIKVQHHHAHIVSCMAEHGLNEPVIGLAFDGTGYGTDGHIWGSEFMVCDLKSFERYCHFEYMPMPGGDKSSEQPWRMGLSLLNAAFGEDFFNLDLPLLKMKHLRLRDVTESIRKKINCPFSSGAGRLFDGIAAITGICMESKFHAEAPMRLESVIVKGVRDAYEAEIAETISFVPVIRAICRDMASGTNTGIISSKFHNTLVDVSVKTAVQIREKTSVNKIVLSGGTFQNKYLAENLELGLLENKFEVYCHGRIPCNDGGIALGQIVVAGTIIN